MAGENDANRVNVILPGDLRVVVANEGSRRSGWSIVDSVVKMLALLIVPFALVFMNGWVDRWAGEQRAATYTAADLILLQEALEILKDEDSQPELRIWSRQVMDQLMLEAKRNLDSSLYSAATAALEGTDTDSTP